MATLFTSGKFQGPALGTLETYAAGTLTPLATYTDQGGATENATTISLDADGQADVWLGENSYRMRCYDANGALQWDTDNISGSGSSSYYAQWRTDTFNGDGSDTTFVLNANPGSIHNLDVSIDGLTLIPLVDYTLSGTTVTFTVAPPTGTANIMARYGQALPQLTRSLEVYIADWGAAEDGVTDDWQPVTDAVAYAASLGGGRVHVTKDTAIGTTLVWPSYVDLVMHGGAQFKWIGSASGTIFQTTVASPVYDCHWNRLAIDTGLSFTGTAVYIHSAHNIVCDLIQLTMTGTTSTGIKMWADGTSGGDANTKRNITAVKLGQIVQRGQCGTLLDVDGLTSGYGGDPQVVTLNSIGAVFAENCSAYGIRLRNWTDNNTFYGNVRLVINGNSGVGVQIGSSTAVGVYANAFNTVAVDTFGTMTGRIGVNVEASKLHKIGMLYQSPVAEGGAFAATYLASSYDVHYMVDSSGEIVHYRRLMRAASEGFNSSGYVALADDAATSFNVAEAGVNENITFMLSVAGDNADSNGIAWCKCRRTSGTPEVKLISGGPNFAVTTGALAGTTGTDTKFTVSPAADGKVYVENRIGAAVNFVISIAAYQQVP